MSTSGHPTDPRHTSSRDTRPGSPVEPDAVEASGADLAVLDTADPAEPDRVPAHLDGTDDHRTHALARLERVGPPRRRRLDVKLLLASMGIAVGLVAIVLGFLTAETGTGEDLLPDAIESIDPVRSATQVPQQTRVFVDFAPGFEGVLIINGVELPVVALDDLGQVPQGLGSDTGDGEQIEIPPGAVFEPGNGTLTFVPGPSQVIDAFARGQHTATVRYWRTADGPGTARVYTWSFYAV